MTSTEPLKIGKLTIPHRLILAPMCGITLKPYRIICKDWGAGLVFNQMVSAKALTMADEKSYKMLTYDESERPVGMPLFGNDADVLAQAAQIVQDTGVDVIDLNLGCPAKKIVNDGGGSALLGNSTKLGAIFRKMRRAIDRIPFTVKMRAGWDERCRNAIDVAQLAQEEGVDAVAIHARTRAQGYSGHSDWDYIAELKDSVRIPVIGNGDVVTALDAVRMMRETRCDAVMTGRGAFQTPWIFRELLTGRPAAPEGRNLRDLILRQYDAFMTHFGESGGIKMMRKHLCSYTHGMRDGAAFRNAAVRIDAWSELHERIEGFFGLGEGI
jgi:nifR3 family TIM-barrel protein